MFKKTTNNYSYIGIGQYENFDIGILSVSADKEKGIIGPKSVSADMKKSLSVYRCFKWSVIFGLNFFCMVLVTQGSMLFKATSTTKNNSKSKNHTSLEVKCQSKGSLPPCFIRWDNNSWFIFLIRFEICMYKKNNINVLCIIFYS